MAFYCYQIFRHVIDIRFCLHIEKKKTIQEIKTSGKREWYQVERESNKYLHHIEKHLFKMQNEE